MSRSNDDVIENRRRFLKGAAGAGALGLASGLGAGPAPAGAAERHAATGTIPARVLGRTGERLPILNLGTSQSLDPTYDKVMHRSFASGITWFDTALSYGWGSSHAAIRNFISQIGERGRLWLTSKSGHGSPARIAAALDDAREQLGTDYLDLFLMHGIRDPDMLEPEYIRMGEELKRAGKTRYFGFSCHDGNVAELMQKAARVGGIDAILFRYNFRRYGDRELNAAMDACHAAGIGLIAMKVQGSVPRSLEAVAGFQSKNFNLGQAKLKSVWADERITSICSEMDSVKLVSDNVEAARSEKSLTAEETHQLNRLAHLTASYSCEGCSHLCEAAAGGAAAIAEPLRYLMYFESYGKTGRARELYRALEPKRLMLDAGALEAARRVCPQGIDIPARLEQAHRMLA